MADIIYLTLKGKKIKGLSLMAAHPMIQSVIDIKKVTQMKF